MGAAGAYDDVVSFGEDAVALGVLGDGWVGVGDFQPDFRPVRACLFLFDGPFGSRDLLEMEGEFVRRGVGDAGRFVRGEDGVFGGSSFCEPEGWSWRRFLRVCSRECTHYRVAGGNEGGGV